MSDVATWWLIVELLGIAALPLATVLFRWLPDRGWALAKALGVLVAGWLVWFPLSVLTFLPYSRAWIAGTIVVFALANAALVWRVASVRAALLRMVARERNYIAASELVFAGGFALMAWIRSFAPAVVDTEKFMDVAFLSAIWRAPHLPPPDPWLSGYPINYYYFGHFLLATLAKLVGTEPNIAFNLGIALIFALTAVAVFGVATNLLASLLPSMRPGSGSDTASSEESQPRLGLAPLAGIVSVLMVLILGNLDGAQVAWQQAVSLSSGPQALLSNPLAYFTNRVLWLDYNWWDPSRVITKPATINEFPAFSFLLADLHAHVMALPFAALALGLALSFVRARGEGLRVYSGGGSRLLGVVTALGAGVSLGALYAINGWDLPTYLGLALLALVIQQWLAHNRRIDSVLLLDLFAVAAALVALAVLLYLPFYRGFVSPSQGVGLVPGYAHSPIGLEFLIFGLQATILGSYLVWQLGRWIGVALRDRGEPLPLALSPRAAGMLVAIVGAAVLTLLTLATTGFLTWTIIWTVLLIAVCAVLALWKLGVWERRAALATPGEDALANDDGGGAGQTGETSPAATLVEDDPNADEVPDKLSGDLRRQVLWRSLQPRLQPPGNQPPDVAFPFLARERGQGGRWPLGEVWLLCLIGTAAALVCACELVFLRDVFAGGPNQLGDAFRMNTVFKLYYQAWLIAGVACGPALVLLVCAALRTLVSHFSALFAIGTAVSQSAAPATAPSLAEPSPVPAGEVVSRLATPTGASGAAESAGASKDSGQLADRAAAKLRMPHHSRIGGESNAPYYQVAALRFASVGGIVVWMALLALLVAGALVYPVLGSAARTQNFSLPTSLDGTAYMASDSVNAGDAEAIAWLNRHVSGDEVIVEAAKYDEYTHYGRISALTGLPALLGWGGHELQWRVNWLDESGHEDILGQRLDAVSQIYTNPDEATVKQLLREYSVRLIYVGTAERQVYPTANLSRFAAFLPIVYNRDGVTIYAGTGGASS